MNCRRFEKQLFEYLDGSLPGARQAALESHLASCAHCRELVSKHRRLAQRLSGEFAQATESLRLRPEIEQRVSRALAAPVERSSWWMDALAGVAGPPRRAWAVAVACAVLAAFGLALYLSSRARPTEARLAQALIQISYPVPTYRFETEGGLVRDTLTYETVVVKSTFSAGR